MRVKSYGAGSLILAGILAFWCTEKVSAQPPLAAGDDAEVTGDGLHRVDASVMAAAWVRPDLDLSRYTSLYYTPAMVGFREVADRRYSEFSASSESVFFVGETEQNRLLQMFGTAFYEDREDVESFEISTDVGRDVLMIRALFLDVVSGVRPTVPGASTSFVNTPWEGTLVLELRDSMSNNVLARTSERERARGPIEIDSLWIRSQQEVGRWSEILYRRLEELLEL